MDSMTTTSTNRRAVSRIVTVTPLTKHERSQIAALIAHAKNGTWPDDADSALSEEIDAYMARASDARDHGAYRDLRAAFNQLTGR
jgi:hypothetical protein